MQLTPGFRGVTSPVSHSVMSPFTALPTKSLILMLPVLVKLVGTVTFTVVPAHIANNVACKHMIQRMQRHTTNSCTPLCSKQVCSKPMYSTARVAARHGSHHTPRLTCTLCSIACGTTQPCCSCLRHCKGIGQHPCFKYRLAAAAATLSPAVQLCHPVTLQKYCLCHNNVITHL